MDWCLVAQGDYLRTLSLPISSLWDGLVLEDCLKYKTYSFGLFRLYGGKQTIELNAFAPVAFLLQRHVLCVLGNEAAHNTKLLFGIAKSDLFF